MAERTPIIRIPEGWTYGETSKFDFGRWVSTYTLKHDVCGKEVRESVDPVGINESSLWYRQKCAEGLAFFLGNHPQNCQAGVTDGDK